MYALQLIGSPLRGQALDVNGHLLDEPSGAGAVHSSWDSEGEGAHASRNAHINEPVHIHNKARSFKQQALFWYDTLESWCSGYTPPFFVCAVVCGGFGSEALLPYTYRSIANAVQADESVFQHRFVMGQSQTPQIENTMESTFLYHEFAIQKCTSEPHCI